MTSQICGSDEYGKERETLVIITVNRRIGDTERYNVLVHAVRPVGALRGNVVVGMSLDNALSLLKTYGWRLDTFNMSSDVSDSEGDDTAALYRLSRSVGTGAPREGLS